MTGNVASWWSCLGISSKLWLVFTLLLTIFGLAGLAAYTGFRVVRLAETDIQANMDIQAKILEMEGQLEKSRRLFRDFLLHAREMEFEAATKQFCQPAQTVAAHVIAISEEFGRLIAASRPDGAIARRKVDLTLFTSMARRYAHTLLQEADLIGVLGNPRDGLQRQFTDIVQTLGRELTNVPGASLLVRELELQGKEYENRRQRPIMQAALNKTDAIRRLADAAPELTALQRQNVRQSLEGYAAVANRMLDTVKAINASDNDFVLQAKAVDPISAELKLLSASAVSQARSRITWASQIATAIMVLAGVMALGCIVLAGRVLHASITGKIVTMTRHAAAIRAGHLDERLPNGTGDELGVLAGAFNDMTCRLKELVETLEEKVRLRTRELAEKNRELDAKNQELSRLSLTDRLTGLCNRRKLDQALSAEWRRARRYGALFTVIMLDLDHFKTINDSHGHDAGDRVLVRVADILLARSRETDIAGRWGGEEFVVICPETSRDEARKMAEDLRRELEETRVPGIGGVTASFGVAGYTLADEEPARLIARADTALYRAKQLGRNRIAGDDDNEGVAAAGGASRP